MADSFKKKKILILTSSFPRYLNDIEGGGIFVYKLSKELQKKAEVIVLAPFMAGSEKEAEIDGMKIKRFKFIPFNLGNLINPSGLAETLHQQKWKFILVPFLLLSQFISAIFLIKKEKINLIHSHWLIPQGLIGSSIRFIMGKKMKIICTVHGSDLNMSFGKIGDYFVSKALKGIDIITVVSNELKNKADSFNSHSEIPVIPMGIDINKFCFNPNSKIKGELKIEGKMLLFVGVFNEVKGIEYALKAMPKVLEYDNTIKFVLVGDGVIKNDLIKICQELNITANVIFAGFKSQNELPDYYSAADIVLMPSLSEGSPVVLPEALNCGAVVLTSDIPIYKELINEGINGFMSKVENSNSIAGKIISILSDPDGIKTVKSSSREYVLNNFDWKVVGEKYLSLIAKL